MSFIVHDESSEKKDWSGGAITPRIEEVPWAAHSQEVRVVKDWTQPSAKLCPSLGDFYL